MASTFPNSIDSFINPVYTKVNGVDYVKAEHINDLQSAARNIEISIIGSGLGLGFNSNFYVPSTASIKDAIDILDGALKARQDAFENHLSYSMPTDPFQHHSNVIQVTSIGNLSSTRAQAAFEELQNNIDMIMSGGYVEGISLDDRYALKDGNVVFTGSVNIDNNLNVLQNVSLGTNTTHSVTIAGDTSVGRDLSVLRNIEIGGDLILPNLSKIGAKDYLNYTNISFTNQGIILNSFKDFLFRLDSDDSIDGEGTLSTFRVESGLGSTVLNLNENGELYVSSKIMTPTLELDSSLVLGSTTKTSFEDQKIEVEAGRFTIKLDSDANDLSPELIVTRNGDNGTADTSTNIVLKATKDSLITGNHSLKRGTQEVGYFGMKFYSDDPGGRFQGYGVNFKTKMLTVPSSITLSIDPLKSMNYNNVSITDINEYGFFIECESLTVGHVELKGTYTTIGN